jgi:CheY-like chemotaxis protein/anti-sigma regulatory factor (Ser/Thr protein kinase)
VSPDDRPTHRIVTTIRVLLVEDDPGLRQALVDILTTAGMEVESAADGREGWRLIEPAPSAFDAVVTDRLMPHVDGMELLRRIKQRRDLILLPVIILTVAARPQEMVEGIDAGAYAYLPKPVDADVLVSVVRSAAADWRHVQELNRHIRSDVETFDLLRRARFDYRSCDQAMGLGVLLAKACPNPDRVVTGLSELLVNAVEHGNLEIGYDEKSRLLRSQGWQREVERRLELPAYAHRVASVEVERTRTGVVFSIRDQGPGFEPAPYLEIDPARVFDAHGRGIALARLLSFDELHYEDGGRCAVAVVQVDDEPS